MGGEGRDSSFKPFVAVDGGTRGTRTRQPDGGPTDGATQDGRQTGKVSPRKLNGHRRAELRKDLVAYARKWATLAKRRKRLKALLKQASGYKTAKNAEKLGGLITGKVVPEFKRLVLALRSFKPRTDTLRRAHLAVVSGYTKMMEAYRLAGRAWQVSGQGLALALRRLKKARTQLKAARKTLAELARQHNVAIK